MRILFITNGYPSVNTPSKTVFLQRLIHEIRDLGNECFVIQPNPFPQAKNIPNQKETHTTVLGNSVTVFYPRYIRFWLTARSRRDYLKEWTEKNYLNAVLDVIKKYKLQFDVVYAHFLSTPTRCAIEVGRLYNVPVFAAAGESNFTFLKEPDAVYAKMCLEKLRGIISVSSENKSLLLDNGIKDENSIAVFPNGINQTVFYPRSKEESRSKFGFNPDDFIIAFTGYFIERKGPLRLQEAVNGLDVKVAYAGKGEQTPKGPNTIWAKPVDPNLMPYFLSAADIFVLPTRREGCCNAIIEAMACGLPVVSSCGHFNDDILSDDYSIRVNPNDCEEIRTAIEKLYYNKDVRESMSRKAMEKAKQLSITERAKNIIMWMDEKMNEGEEVT